MNSRLVGLRGSFLAVLILCSCFSALAAEAGPFGQRPPYGSPEIFAPGQISINGRYEFAMSFSPTGDELLFTVDAGDGAALYHSRLTGDRWTEPKKISLSNGAKASEMEAFFTPDGKAIYFAAYDKGMDVRLWMVERAGEEWKSPRMLPEPLASTPAFYPTIAEDGTVYYTDLAVRGVASARYDGSALSSVSKVDLKFGGHPFIAPDGTFLLLDSASLNGGPRDLFVAFPTEKGWSRPVPLGGGVNTEYSETCPSLSADGKYLFFSRYDEADRKSNIYWVSATVIESARDRLEERNLQKAAIEAAVRDCFLWAKEKDRPRLEKVIAHDDAYFSWHPRGMTPVVGWDQFVRGFDNWMDPRFEATRFDLRDLRINLSANGRVAWFSGVLDDCYIWDGTPGCWDDTRWTGVLELRGEQWTIVQMHFSFPADRFEKPAEGQPSAGSS